METFDAILRALNKRSRTIFDFDFFGKNLKSLILFVNDIQLQKGLVTFQEELLTKWLRDNWGILPARTHLFYYHLLVSVTQIYTLE